MNSRFPELRFCELDWKSEQVATDNYPSWYTTWAFKSKELKHENEEDTIIKPETAQSKRHASHQCSPHRNGKRSKIRQMEMTL